MRLTAATATAVLLLVAAPAITAGRTRPRPCRPSGSHTVLANRVARVYTIQSRVSGVGTVYYGCVYSTRRRTLLETADFPKPMRLTGTTLADAEETGDSIEIFVTDLRRGRQIYGDRIEGTPYYDQPVLKALVLKANGAIAWIIEGVDHSLTPPNGEVGRHDRRGRQTLDIAPDGQLRALRLTGSTLSWTHGGVARTSNLG
jgi:hypothetical protein